MDGLQPESQILKLNPIPTGHGLNQPIYCYHVTQAGRNRVKKVKIGQLVSFILDTKLVD